jgi:hypothetical protein
MFFGNNQKMDWGCRINVIKSEDFFVLIDLLGRYFPGNNLAKNAAGVMARMIHGHGSYPKTSPKQGALGYLGLIKAYGPLSLPNPKPPPDA